MGDLISRLKLVSITSCVLSIGVLPALVFLKNGEFPTVQQTSRGGIAFLGATGSTCALEFVFGPYILTMKQLPRKNSQDEDASGHSEYPYLLEAKTRSVFGWKNTYTFDPLADITPYEGARPFANFCAKGVPLYAHPELLDSVTRSFLLLKQPSEENSQQQQHPRDQEGLKQTHNNPKDDDFF